MSFTGQFLAASRVTWNHPNRAIPIHPPWSERRAMHERLESPQGSGWLVFASIARGGQFGRLLAAYGGYRSRAA
jgi:hypothetical protein